MEIQQECVTTYRRLRNLKLVAVEVGIPWQKVYVYLRAAGEPVTGDKSRYGSDTDRLAAKAENEFKRLVPNCTNLNDQKFQAKIDFSVGPLSVDVKASRRHNDRWAFSLKKQELLADFFVCFAFDDDGSYRVVVIPNELCRHYQTLSLSANSKTKWWDYEVDPASLASFFDSIVKISQEQAA